MIHSFCTDCTASSESNCVFILFKVNVLFILPSTESLEDLTSMVVKLFGEVENKNVPLPDFPTNPFQEEHLRVSANS